MSREKEKGQRQPELEDTGLGGLRLPLCTPEPFMVLDKQVQRDVLHADGVEMCSITPFLLLSLCSPPFYTQATQSFMQGVFFNAARAARQPAEW